MADISTVENTLVSALVDILFTTSYTPYTVQVSDNTGINLRLYRGWPIDQQLNIDLQAGVTNISVFSAPAVARNTTRYLRNSTIVPVSKVDPTMFASLSGSQVTFTGTGNAGQVIGIGVRKRGAEYGYSTRLTDAQTPTQVASLFAANLIGATSTGPVLTVDAPHNEIVVSSGGDATSLMEVRRQDQMFMVTIWSPTVAIRDQICNFIDPQLMFLGQLSFPEGSVSGPIRGAGTCVDDKIAKEYMWKRGLFYMIEFPTEYVITETPAVLIKDNIGVITLID